MNTIQQYMKVLISGFEQLEKSVYGDNSRHQHLYPSINHFRVYSTRILSETYEIYGQLPAEILSDTQLRLIYDFERQLEKELQSLSREKDNDSLYYKLESLLLQMKGLFNEVLSKANQMK